MEPIDSSVMTMFSIICGILYTVAWSASFYPQCVDNCRRKSVVGLSFDFEPLNMSGYIGYSIYNCCFYFSDEIIDEYRAKNPGGDDPVEAVDVAFSLHGACLTAFTLFQMAIYEKGGQKFSWVAIGLTILIWISVVAVIITCGVGALEWLNLIYYFSYIKLAITAIKYTPQAWINFRRKCTHGWSIGNVLLDTTGGLLSLLQMLLIALNTGNWTDFTHNPTKLGLSVLSLLYDSLFIFQHYVLYRGNKPPPAKKQETKDTTETDNGDPSKPLLSDSTINSHPKDTLHETV